uniref:Glutathione S-transferase n=1 Tax=Romanomermis culicivorax TaxID=13658 RepID=A0A915JCX9_ROMCU
MICQSMAMARYVAKEHGLVPTNNFLAARADMIGELWQAYKKEHLPNFLDIYEKLLTENGGKFFVGNHLTWADLMVAELLDRFVMFNKNDG